MNGYEVIKILVDKGADVNAKTEDGFTALSMAQEKGLEDVVKYLKEHGAKK